jgi:uroporphyrinogen decarboxylase
MPEGLTSMQASPFSVPVVPDWEGFINCIRQTGTPARAYFIELIIDGEVQDYICQRYGLLDDLSPADPFYKYKRQIALQSFLGYDYVVVPSSLGETTDFDLSNYSLVTDDTASLKRRSGRSYVNEHRGPITSWEEFESFPWPKPATHDVPSLDWFEANLPENMCMIGGLTGSIYENLSWLMGYETLCYALSEQRDLVAAISQKVIEKYSQELEYILQYDRVKVIWGSDDLGFKTSTLISPKDLREFVLPGHKLLSKMAHEAGRSYIMHCCGNLARIIDNLIEDVCIDGKHSFEDTIEDICESKSSYGKHIALLGGIDVDFLCRSSEGQIRQRVRHTLDCCLPGGGFCLGTGNTVANYIPVETYLIMLDEGRRYMG